MSERSRRNRRDPSRPRRSSRAAHAEPSEADTGTPAAEPGEAAPEAPAQPTTLDDANARIAELTADLEAAKSTIKALLDKAERKTTLPAPAGSGRGDGLSATSVPRAMRQEVGAEEVARGLSEQPEMTSNLDKLVRQQTRALAESEAQLRRKNAELKRLNEMKAEFISIAAHELRTPLTSIVGYLDLVHEGRFGATPTAMERPLASLRRNAHRLRRLVDEMLDVSRIEQGQIHLYRVSCDLGDIVKAVVAELEPLATDKSLQLIAHVHEPPPIHADMEKIHQAVSKLVASAIRYTPEGGTIAVTVDAAPQERFAGAWTRLRVKHIGIGIPRHLHSRIFEPFFDVQSARHHTSSGPDSAGLGLYIARGLIDLHGGLISIDSEEDSFTEFTVLLPMAADKAT